MIIFAKKTLAMDKLQQNFGKLLRGVTTNFYRYIYDKIDWGNRMIGLTGPRVLARPQ